MNPESTPIRRIQLIFGLVALSVVAAGVWFSRTQSILFDAAVLLLAGTIGLLYWQFMQKERYRALYQAEAARLDVERRHRLATEAARTALWRMDLATGVMETDGFLERIIGYNPGDIGVAPTWMAVTHVDDRGWVGRLWQSVVDGESDSYDLEYRLVHKDGSTRWVDVHGAASRPGPGQKATAITGTTRDITTRKQTELNLAESQRRLATLFANLPGMAYRCLNDFDWTMEYVSDGALELTGYRRDQLQASRDVSYGGLVHPDDVESVRQGVLDAVAERRPFQLNYRIRTAAGRYKWVWEQGVGVFDDGGRLVALEGFVADISERKSAGDLVRRSEERLRLALAAANQGYYDLDLLTGEAEVSHEYATMLGFDPAEFHESHGAWLERMHPDDVAPVTAIYEAYMAGSIPEYRVEFRQRASTGAWKWILSLGRIVERGPDGAPLRMMGTHTDITAQKSAEDERKDLQAALIQAQKMESVGRLAGGVAHDFNNMLSVILGHAEIAIEALPPLSPLHDQIIEIQAAARRSADLTRQLLGYARRQTAAPRVLDINTTVTGMLKMLRRLIGENIDLVWEPGNAVSCVDIDPVQLDQVLANLAVNARDAIDGVGNVTIATANVTLDDVYCATHAGFQPGRYVMLSVTDDGVGMTTEVLEHIFEPFFTTKSTGKGTGLGLATVYGIVKQNRGFVDVSSESGKGTTFKIFLPLASTHAEQPATRRPVVPPMARGETLLLVEDEPSVLRLGVAMLERLGYTVLAAGTPADAMRIAETHPWTIHLLVTDVVLPEMNGRDLAARLGAARPGLKCLFVSGYAANVIAHRGVLDQGVFFLQKPYSLDALAMKTREALS